MKPLKDVIRPTLFLTSEKLSREMGLDLTIATETFQRTGSFKFRAAYNTALNTNTDHLITASSGNFGQALALACKMLRKRCHVVMPETSAQVKIDAVRSLGAEVILIDTRSVGREERVSQLMEEFQDAYRASAYDDENVIEGNSSLGDEIAARSDFDAVIVPVGGGGLISGISKGLCRAGDRAKLFGAEPALGNDAARSLASGELLKNESEPLTLADGARTLSLGKQNWKIIRDGVKKIYEVPENSIRDAVHAYFLDLNLKVEPTGALSLAALTDNHGDFAGKQVCCVVSGGNVDPAVYSDLISRH
ncbi:MAG: pyridoxal-phosphate dependent enzyme [Acidobacteria bacterium]|nr:MAG: pyridoxal-phosphate dependent enzyme [Acidobacteriota bacterium]REK01784.1 MAG: pyridoxal-phosphate dependent enzyme [Acidobacteriota bacterium]REK14740.1 MAG: pyridoxal-phosphate dependent enzyme [Acidobacteriota bacterium]REK45455.1 MAG: pyridoxal-phosphate dependent enzyme [Acidobacteriota bacterium]